MSQKRLAVICVAIQCLGWSSWVGVVHGQKRTVLTGRIEWSIAGEGANYLLSKVVGIVSLPAGEIAILSADERMIRVFDQLGNLVRSFGRDGAGPGEFRSPRALGRVGDSLWVWDFSLSRVTIFRVSGHLEGTRLLPVRGRGYLLMAGSLGIFPARAYGTGDVGRNDTLIVQRVPQGGGVATTFKKVAPYRVFRVFVGGRTIVGQQPFDDPPLLVPSLNGSGFVVIDRTAAPSARGAEFRVTRMNFRGDTVFSRKLSYSPIRISPQLVAETVDYLAGPLPAPTATVVKPAILQQLYVPKFLPPVSAAFLGRDGSVWLRREESAPGRSRQWTVLDQSGATKFEVDLDDRLLPFEVEGMTIWGVLTLEDGSSSVVRVRLGIPGRRVNQ